MSNKDDRACRLVEISWMSAHWVTRPNCFGHPKNLICHKGSKCTFSWVLPYQQQNRLRGNSKKMLSNPTGQRDGGRGPDQPVPYGLGGEGVGPTGMMPNIAYLDHRGCTPESTVRKENQVPPPRERTLQSQISRCGYLKGTSTMTTHEALMLCVQSLYSVRCA